LFYKKKQFQKNSQQKKQPAKYQKYMRDGVTDSRKKKGCPGFLHDQTTNFGANDFFIKIISQYLSAVFGLGKEFKILWRLFGIQLYPAANWWWWVEWRGSGRKNYKKVLHPIFVGWAEKQLKRRRS
jgi:hypothetical protein